MSRYWCELAWLGGPAPAPGVLLTAANGALTSVEVNVMAAPAGAATLRGLTLPGLANAHSHCFQRALRGRTQREAAGSFWSWREQMYALAARLDAASFEALARATFAEMALAGVTLVGEFDYLHHTEAVVRAAAAAGIRLTLIDACYLSGGLPQFRDASVEEWCARVGGLPTGRLVRPAAAIHSLRAVDPAAAATVAAFTAERGWPLHAHVSEQERENAECLSRYGARPVELLSRAGALSSRFTAVHATFLSDDEKQLMQDSGAYCCMCPTTERDLADGIGPVAGRLTLGSDSQAVIDMFEEARAVELDNRLATGVRGVHGAVQLAAGLTVNGYASLGWPLGGSLQPGAPADLTTIALDSVRLAGTVPDEALDATLFAGTAADVTNVIVDGEFVVKDRRHVSIDVATELASAIARIGDRDNTTSATPGTTVT